MTARTPLARCPRPNTASHPGTAAGLHRPIARPAIGLASLALAVAMLSACGGGNDGATYGRRVLVVEQDERLLATYGTDGTTGSGAVILSETAQGLSVALQDGAAIASASGAASEASGSTGAVVKSRRGSRDTAEPDEDDHAAIQWSSTQYTLSAVIDSGPGAGTSLTGALMLRGELRSDGTTRLEGRFVPSLASSTVLASRMGGATAPTGAVAASRDSYRSQVRELASQLDESIRRHAGDATATRAAVVTFTARMREATESLQNALDDSLSSADDGARSSRTSRGGKVEVRGTISTTGAVTLRFAWSGHAVTLTGQQAADGRLSGTFTDSRTGDAGCSTLASRSACCGVETSWRSR